MASKTLLQACDINLYWLDEEKSIQENKINEARAILKSVDKDTVQSVLAAINKLTLKGYDDGDMIALLNKLYTCLQDEQQIQFSSDQHLAKNLILKTVFNFIDSPNEMLLLHIVQIILLVSAFVNSLGLATPDEDSEALIYGYGALKFLMMNSSILQCALDNGILQLMSLHLKMVNLCKTENSNFPEPVSHVLFQLTGCLRNVANDESTHTIFVTSGTLTAISKTMKLFICDIDLVVNVARIMSILSLNEECCEVIVDNDSLHTLLQICKKYPGREDIIVRIMYVLGNTVANSERARFQLFTSPENTLEVILNLLQFYVEADLKVSLENTFNKFHLLSVEDVFVKIIRVIANMCIDENVGVSLVSTNDSMPKMNEFLDCLLTILRRKTIHESEELVLSILNTLNNLSYYSLPNTKRPFGNRCLYICEALNSLMATRHEECVLEVGRVYGNLSRSTVVRKYLLETGALNYVIDWLDSDDKDLLLVTTGILINMMVEKEARKFLRHTKGIEKLIENLKHHAHEDWHLSSLMCQVLWNFSIEEDDLFAILGNQLAQNLLNVLIDLLDEDRFFSNFNDHSKNLEYKLWEEFSTVATNILEKMEAHNNSE
ncbi:hypothetical protein V9T40_007055 [Parthenolecanium corni]|uniref:Armadillo repeat-containing protein 2 n=1 Tax=Parthenolecanium corni TaxID=536013 RepID=A0AAN9TUL4_9HEMI